MRIPSESTVNTAPTAADTHEKKGQAPFFQKKVPVPEFHELTAEESAEADRILARAVLARALKLGLDRPTVECLGELCGREGRLALRSAARTLDEDSDGALRRALYGILALPKPALDGLASRHEDLFGHTLRGRVCPYECQYGPPGPFQQAHELADLSGFYAAFGLGVASGADRRERPDHVVTELEFLEFLSVKEALELGQGQAEEREVTREAARKFLREHLARFGRAFARDLRNADRGGLYGRMGGLLEAFLAVECERLGVPLGPASMELRPEEPDDVPAACGTGDDGLVQIGGRAC